MGETPNTREDQPEVIVHEDALAELIKKAKPEEVKEIEALVTLVQTDMKATQKSMESLLTDMASNPANLEQKDLVKTAIEATVFSMSDEHRTEEARDIVYQTLTHQPNAKKSFFKKMFGPEGFIGGIKNAVKQKFLGVDLKKEQEEKQQTINAVVQKYSPQIDDLKKKLGFAVDTPVVKTPDPTAKKEEEKKDETKKAPDKPINKENEGFAEQSHYTVEEQRTIENVIINAQEYQNVKYSYGGTNKEGIDCSGLWSQALKKEFKDEGQTFGRLTAALFDTQAPDIGNDKVERGDWMFWEDPNGIKKGGTNEKGTKIYHIEMALGKPFEKNGKKYVKTYGSSSSKPVYDEAGKDIGNVGVGYRIREIKDTHHFAKPKYYQDLVQIKKENNEMRAAA